MRTAIRRRLFALVGRAGVGDKSANLARIFAAGLGFDAADDIHAPGMERGDCLGDIFRREAAGGDELTFFCKLIKVARAADQSNGTPVPPTA